MRHGKTIIFAASLFVLAGYGLLSNGLLRERQSSSKGKPMIFETIIVGQLGVNCFILGAPETGEGVVVDPGAEPERILAVVKRHGLKIKYILNTHGHFDHVGGNRRLLAETGAPLLIHEADVPFLARAAASAASYGLAAENSPEPDQFLVDGKELTFGAHRIVVLHTPGHTPGGCSLYLADQGIVLTGDTLFADSVGRTDFPGSSHEALVKGIKDKLFTLPGETKVYPGHGPATTIGREQRYNPYLTGL